MALVHSIVAEWMPSSVTYQVVEATVIAIITLAVYNFLHSLYCRMWHPLSKFPGEPKAATSGGWIYRVTARGFPEEELEKLHKKYQTNALRIGPNELHITDPQQYKVIYNQAKPFPKEARFYEAFNTPNTLFTEMDAGRHKERRRLLNPMFSRAGVFKLEPMIHSKTQVMLAKIKRLQKEHEINVYDAFRCLTTEVIMEFAFARSANMLEESPVTFHSWYLDAFDAVAFSIWKMQEFPIVRKSLGWLPLGFIGLMDSKVINVAKILKFSESCLQHYITHDKETSHPVVFDNLSSLPYEHKVTESMAILIAGSDTTAATLTAGFLHILSSPHIHKRLVKALQDSGLDANNYDTFQLLDLEKIDYLASLNSRSAKILLTLCFSNEQTACVKESLRIGIAVPGRLPRIVPNDLPQPLVVDGQVVPPGTVVSMSAYTMHTNEDIWGPDARKFNPERWLKPESKSLEQYLCTFSKGARMCIGQNVAYAEITIVMAYLFRSFDLRLPHGFVPPERKDLFTMEYLKPGLPVRFSSVC